jgi:hypothetical protein
MSKNILTLAVVAAFMSIMVSCGGGESAEKTGEATEQPQSMVAEPSSYDPKRGEGKFDESNITIGPIDAAMVKKGEEISGTKCNSCHKMTDEKLVGPGWAGVTTRRTPAWIMNFITNPDPMIDKDPEVQAQLELCLVRMPNQGLSDVDAREILEFMRKNDEAK